MRRYLGVFTVVFTLFALLVSVGFFAHLVVPREALVDPATGAFRQDLVMTVYLQHAFPDRVFTVISVVLLAAAMSTLDGLLVALSTITANDLLLNLVERCGNADLTPEAQQAFAYRASHVVLVLVAGATYLTCLDPPALLGIFGQTGVYGMVLAAVTPLVAGVLFRRVPLRGVWAIAVLAPAVHFGLFFFGARLFPGAPFTFANPGVTATLVVLTVVLSVLVLVAVWSRRQKPAEAAAGAA